jgi:S-adenosylmethionine-diacylgycerolhomoserine-N-methlytransferase
MSMQPAMLGPDSTRHQARMDRKYRRERHVFDLTRKFFLFGRDRAIDNLSVDGAETILEIGVGTARNLAILARLAPTARLAGLDISTEMLKSARAKVRRRNLADRVRLLHGDATDPAALEVFGQPSRILMSYSLSMMPDWRRALAIAIAALPPGGILSIVDFGDFRDWPRRLRDLSIRMLAIHDAPPCIELADELNRHGESASVGFRHTSGLGGFYQIATVTRHASH